MKACAGGPAVGLVLNVGMPPVAQLRPMAVVADRLDVGDIARLTSWRNSNRDAFLTDFEATPERTAAWLTNTVAHDDGRILFMIDDPTGRPFGYMGLARIDWQSRSGEADAVVRGEESPAGVMGQALQTLLSWACSSLGLRHLSVRVRSDNPAVGFYAHVGFREVERVPLRLEGEGDSRVWMERSWGDVRCGARPYGVRTRGEGMRRIAVDFDRAMVEVEDGEGRREFALGSSAGFSAVSDAWIRAGWDAKYVYGFTWLGRPIIQLPDDLIRLQEVIYSVQPDVIVETGVAHGGSLIFSASLCRVIGRGRVIGVDVEVRPHNRSAIEEHPLADLITLIEGDSVATSIVEQVRSLIMPTETVLVFLDSNHSARHVLAELNAYAPMVSVGSYIVAMDGIMGELAGAPRTEPDWTWDNPRAAAAEYIASHDDYIIEEPARPFDEGAASQRVTYWPDAFLRRIR